MAGTILIASCTHGLTDFSRFDTKHHCFLFKKNFMIVLISVPLNACCDIYRLGTLYWFGKDKFTLNQKNQYLSV